MNAKNKSHQLLLMTLINILNFKEYTFKIEQYEVDEKVDEWLW